MSHVAAIELEITDLQALKAACNKLGWEFRENQKTFKWFGRWVNDYDAQDAAYKFGIKPEDYGKCSHAIKIPNVQYEIGLIKQDNKFKAIFDFYSQKLKNAVGGQSCPKLKQMYAVAKTYAEAKKKGYKVHEKKLKDNTIKLTITSGFGGW